MKRYGVELLRVDGIGANFIEHRALSFISSLVLSALFSEPWIIFLGLAFVVLGWFAERWPENAILLSGVIPLAALLWFLMALVAFGKVLPGSLVFGVISIALVLDGLRTLQVRKPQAKNG